MYHFMSADPNLDSAPLITFDEHSDNSRDGIHCSVSKWTLLGFFQRHKLGMILLSLFWLGTPGLAVGFMFLLTATAGVSIPATVIGMATWAFTLLFGHILTTIISLPIFAGMVYRDRRNAYRYIRIDDLGGAPIPLRAHDLKDFAASSTFVEHLASTNPGINDFLQDPTFQSGMAQALMPVLRQHDYAHPPPTEFIQNDVAQGLVQSTLKGMVDNPAFGNMMKAFSREVTDAQSTPAGYESEEMKHVLRHNADSYIRLMNYQMPAEYQVTEGEFYMAVEHSGFNGVLELGKNFPPNFSISQAIARKTSEGYKQCLLDTAEVQVAVINAINPEMNLQESRFRALVQVQGAQAHANLHMEAKMGALQQQYPDGGGTIDLRM